jgi:glycosyltransferase involved in cell wall biosynthesis
MTGDKPTVTVAVPVLNEARYIHACLSAIARQTHDRVLEVLVVDGGSTDATLELARSHPGVRVLANPRRIQAAALNIALAEAKGEVFVRVDGHCVIAPDYIERCVAALAVTNAGMVGGAMTPVASGWRQRGIAAAMSSPLGAGPARFHSGGEAGWVDTVYLGAFRTDLAAEAGGYAEDVGVNEDAELALRLRPRGGIWFDPAIRSTYSPRENLSAVARQFYRYGRSRALTIRKHPAAISPRQLVAPALVLALCSPWRRPTLAAYALGAFAASAQQCRQDPSAVPGMTLTLPAMHLPWGVGFLVGLARPGTQIR